MGRVWDGLGHFGGAPGRLLAVLGPLKMYLFSKMGPTWTPKSFLDPSWLDFGRVWKAFGEGFGSISEFLTKLDGTTMMYVLISGFVSGA